MSKETQASTANDITRVLGVAEPAPLFPGQPDANFSDIFVLFYRFGSNPHTQSKQFRHSGNFQDAIARGRRHCELVNLRFIKVEKFFSDLGEEERIHNT